MDHRPSPPPSAAAAGGALALLAAGALVLAAFLPWTDDGEVAVDVALRVGADLPTLGLVLIVLAAVPALATLVTRRAWPAGATAAGAAAVALGWLLVGPSARLVTGPWTALLAAVALLYAWALAD